MDSFAPAKPKKPASEPQAAAAAGFTRREPLQAASKGREPFAKQQRRRRIERNAQINIKAKQDTLDQFYAAVDATGCGVGEAFEIAVDLLQKSIG